MQPISDNVLMINAGEPIPEEIGQEFLKIYLAGSVDLGDTYDWQTKFCNGLAALCDPVKGLIMMKNQNFVVINSRFQPQNPEVSIQNPEFITKLTWQMDMMEAADAIFCNFLKKSTAPLPLLEFGMAVHSQKMVVRCPEDYMNYPAVKVVCEKYGIPLYPSAISAVSNIVQGMYAYVPRFQEITNTINQLPE